MRWNRGLIALLIVAGGFSAVVAYEWRAAESVAPPANVTSTDSFFGWQPGSHPAVLRKRDGDEHLVVFGPLAGFVPSGPAAYVFDKSGRLIDWTVDCGDDATFQRRWDPAGPRIDVDRDVADSWVESRSS